MTVFLLNAKFLNVCFQRTADGVKISKKGMKMQDSIKNVRQIRACYESVSGQECYMTFENKFTEDYVKYLESVIKVISKTCPDLIYQVLNFKDFYQLL